jgi:hypothetical protein
MREREMRLIMILALSLAGGAAQAQIQPPKNPYAISPPTLGSTASGGAFKPYEGYQPPKVSADPFSPAGEAERERRAAKAEQARTNGAFSPVGEAKRERDQAKRDKANNPF